MKTWYNSKIFMNFASFSCVIFFGPKCPDTPKSYTIVSYCSSILSVSYVFLFLDNSSICLKLSMRCPVLYYSNLFFAKQLDGLGKKFLGTPLYHSVLFKNIRFLTCKLLLKDNQLKKRQITLKT